VNVETWVPIGISCLAFGLSAYALRQTNARRKAKVIITIGKLNDEDEDLAGPEHFYPYQLCEPRAHDPLEEEADQPNGGWVPSVRYPIPADVTLTNSGRGDAWAITVTIPRTGNDNREFADDPCTTLLEFEGSLRPNGKTSLLVGLPHREFRYRVTWQDEAGEHRAKPEKFKCDWPEQQWPR
jgi:hypothetical protein